MKHSRISFAFIISVAVAICQLVHYGVTMHAHPVLAVPTLLVTALAAVGPLVTFWICDDRGVVGAQTLSRRAASWMVLSCLPVWPAILMNRFDAGIAAWQTMALGIVGASLVLRYAHSGALRWLVPCALAIAALVLTPVAHEFAINCAVVGTALGVHAIEARYSEAS